MATVFTYYEPVEGMAYPAKLIDLWRESWEGKGWECRILSEKDAVGHPGFKQYVERINLYPTVNNPQYERACFIRHMAMAMAGGGLAVDYDVLNRNCGPKYAKLNFDPKSDPMIIEPTKVPCAVSGDSDAFGEICDIIYDYQPNETDLVGYRPHVSDMTILRKSAVRCAGFCIEHLHDGWKTAPMIHFSNYSFSKLGWTGDKANLIRRVLQTL